MPEHHKNVPSAREIRNSHGGAHTRDDVHGPGNLAPVQLPADPTPDSAGFEASLDQLVAVRAQLSQELSRIPGMVTHAAQLQHDLEDGHGPVSHAMRKLFRQRAGDDDGVTIAIAQYQGELTNLIASMDQTIAHYQAAEDAARQSLPEEPQNV